MEEFIKDGRAPMHIAYLRECGIFAKLNEIFRKLYRVKPYDILNFVREELGDKPTPTEIIENMEHELDEAHREIRRLRGILKELGVNIPDKQLYEADSPPVVRVIDLTALYDEDMSD